MDEKMVDEKMVDDFVVLAARHARQLRTMIGAPHAAEAAQDASPRLMLAALDAAALDLHATFRLVDAGQVDTLPVCGVWTLTELAGHLADWDALFLRWLKILRGETPDVVEWDAAWDEDGDALNAFMMAKRAGQPWSNAWKAMRERRAELVGALVAIDAEEFMRVQPTRAEVAYPTIYHCAWSALEHYLDHAAGVRRALQLPLGVELLEFHGPYT